MTKRMHVPGFIETVGKGVLARAMNGQPDKADGPSGVRPVVCPAVTGDRVERDANLIVALRSGSTIVGENKMDQPTYRGRAAFTLVELMVVISIISLLIALLLPVLGKARDASRQAVCLSTVRQLNMASMNYAFEQRRLIPISVGPTITAMPWRHILIKYQYISTDKALICPSDRTSNAVDLTNPSRYFLLQSYGINFVMDIDINETTTEDRLHFYGDPATRPFSPYGIDSVRKPSSTIFMGDLEYVVNAMEPVNKWVAHGTGGSNAGYMRFGPHNWWGVNDPWFMFPQHNGTSSTAFYDGHARAVSIEQEIQGRGLGTELCIFDNK